MGLILDLSRRLVTAVTAALLVGCASAPSRFQPLPEALSAQAQIPGIPGARYWGDTQPPGFDAWLSLPDAEVAANFSGVMNRPHHYLSLSGGGADGAYGAGILVGWTAHGTRPEFTLVTGTSTGALIAPFAFLGPKYDALLRKLYTEVSTADLIERRGLLDILRNDSAASSAPLRRLLERYIDDAIVAELAEQHRRGRSLLHRHDEPRRSPAGHLERDAHRSQWVTACPHADPRRPARVGIDSGDISARDDRGRSRRPPLRRDARGWRRDFAGLRLPHGA